VNTGHMAFGDTYHPSFRRFTARVFYCHRADTVASLMWSAINGGCWIVEVMNDRGEWIFRTLHPTYRDAHDEIANLDPDLLCEDGW
jgi:hypothetical protein